LNVSREMLQDDAVIRKIRSNIVGRVLATLAEMKKEKPDDYRTFYTAFGRILKEGFHFDHDNHAKLQELAMFRSARTEGDAFIALRQYRDAMPSTQTEIFYLTAESLEAARQSPHLEAVVKSGCDVLLFTDAIDQWVADELESYDGCKLRAIDKGDLELGSEADKAESKHKIEEAGKEFQPLLALIRAKLGDEVKDVRLSSRLTDSACCLVADERALNATMERMMRAMNQEVPKQARILEVNADHALLKRMKAMQEADAADPRLADYVELLHGQALLGEGSTPRNPQRFTRVLADLMAKV
jgi:molecular chaperone HtpG